MTDPDLGTVRGGYSLRVRMEGPYLCTAMGGLRTDIQGSWTLGPDPGTARGGHCCGSERKARTQVRRGAFHRCGPEGVRSVAQNTHTPIHSASAKGGVHSGLRTLTQRSTNGHHQTQIPGGDNTQAQGLPFCVPCRENMGLLGGGKPTRN